MNQSSDRTGPSAVGIALIMIFGVLATSVLTGLYLLLPESVKSNPFRLGVAIVVAIMVAFIGIVWINVRPSGAALNEALKRSNDAR